MKNMKKHILDDKCYIVRNSIEHPAVRRKLLATWHPTDADLDAGGMNLPAQRYQ